MALVVSDTSPIRALDFVGELGLLAKLYQTIYVPPSVASELVRPKVRFKSIDVGIHAGFQVRVPTNTGRVAELRAQLHDGEAEAIALAEELSLALLIDERAGRQIARQSGVSVTGVIGLLVEGKNAGLIPAVIPLLKQMQNGLGFYIAPALVEKIRATAGE